MADERESIRDRYRAANQDRRDDIDGFLKSNRGGVFVWGGIICIVAGFIWSLVAR
ncbi:hypothetical protein [Curtobacterium sp. MCBD17_040]|uniref:hypothetical protein n=1 Tax=Curtobacterium sp. MCBD17_040 TaxID=2175674 RepID=UPI0015E8AFF2|nr:hypothetical protein [Curtobacterium sp. MCBD17_040]WIB65692.1 hypothetical protein DEI94_16355 [Curtobacterium sp. MCBD17_040]